MSFVEIAGNPVPEGAREHWLKGAGGLSIRTLTAPAQGAAPRGSIILCPGRTEFIEKYFEVIAKLQARGFAVLCIDWRGQGLSDRETREQEKGHIGDFGRAARDLGEAVRQNAAQLPRPHILLAHSMGGALSLLALQKNHLTVEAAAFSAPMWGIAALKGPALNAARAMAALGFGKAYAPGASKAWSRESFEGNPVTHDAVRHARCMDLIEKEPKLALAGPTIGWAAAAADVMAGFQKPGALQHLAMPVLVATAAEEKLVDNAAHAQVAALLPNATHITIPGAMHEIMMETDDRQAPFWDAFDALLARLPAVQS
ncbi:MAG: alpha/beta fold hydrolase [Alphaproteobacteria bacterium]|nr:alpha/beta fold hydrolase [Alphaproteobacteria bacterium]